MTESSCWMDIFFGNEKRNEKKYKNGNKVSGLLFTNMRVCFYLIKSLTLTSPIMSLTNPSTSAPSSAPVLLCGENNN